MNPGKLAGKIFAAATEVHEGIGPGPLESACQECLCHELDSTAFALEA